MKWKMILKKMDYNQLSDYEKRNIFYEIVGDTAYEEIELGDFINSYYDSEGYSEIPRDFGVSDNKFQLLALGGMDIYEDGDEEYVDVNFDVYLRNMEDREETYYIGSISYNKETDDYKMSDADEDWELEDLPFSDFLEFSESEVVLELTTFEQFNRGVDYNELVSHLRETGKWNDEDMASSMKPAKVSHRQEVNEWLEEAENYATQKFEQSYSPQDDASIEDAQDFYKLLEYLETTNEDDWDENKMKRDFGAAMVIVSETLGGLP